MPDLREQWPSLSPVERVSISSSQLEGYSLIRLAPDGFVLTIAETPDDIIQKLTSICEEGENRGG